MREALFFFIFLIFIFTTQPESHGQTLGGNTGFNFLNLPSTTQLSALGGINLSNRSNDVGLSFNNPSVLREEMHGQVQANFNFMYAGIKNLGLVGGYFNERINTSFGLGISYLDYGKIPETDAAGNLLGEFHPRDYVIQLSASRRYEERWRYGATIKYIQSIYGQYSSSAIALDVAGSYYDSSRLLQVSLLLKNMGAQLKPFTNFVTEELPFDLQIGVSKRLKKAPVQFSLTAHHLQQFNISYEDTSNQGDPSLDTESSGIDKVFQHLVFATQLYIEEKIEITAAYNHLRRKELSISNTSNGFTGFSMGIGLIVKKLQIRYARSWYQNNTAYNQLGLGLVLN